MVTGGTFPAGTVLLTVNPKHATDAGALTLVPSPASWAAAVASKTVTCAPIKATAVEPATSPMVSRKALVLTGQAGPTLWARALAQDGVTAPSISAETGMLTVLAIQASRAGLQAGGSHPARSTVALPKDRVARGPIETGTNLAAVKPKGERWASLGTVWAPAASWADARASDSITGGPGGAVAGTATV